MTKRQCPCCGDTYGEYGFDAKDYPHEMVNSITAQFRAPVCIYCMDDLIRAEDTGDWIKVEDAFEDDGSYFATQAGLAEYLAECSDNALHVTFESASWRFV